jgi:hypothetical protein
MVKNVDSHPKNSKKSNTSQAKTVGGRTALRELAQSLPASATQRLEEPKKRIGSELSNGEYYLPKTCLSYLVTVNSACISLEEIPLLQNQSNPSNL